MADQIYPGLAMRVLSLPTIFTGRLLELAVLGYSHTPSYFFSVGTRDSSGSAQINEWTFIHFLSTQIVPFSQTFK